MTPLRGGYRSLIVASALAMAASCTAGHPGSTAAPSWPTTGGTLRVAAVLDGSAGSCTLRMCGQPFDPQVSTLEASFELAHCCLMSTLLGFNGRSVDQGGSELQPDLAAGLPTISGDGLTWTFTLRQAVHYAPPMADTQIVAGGFRPLVRAGLVAFDPGRSMVVPQLAQGWVLRGVLPAGRDRGCSGFRQRKD